MEALTNHEAFASGVNEREAAAPATEAESTIAASGGTEDTARPHESQSSEENSRYAAARRKAERQRDEAIAAAQKEVNEAIAALELKDPESDEPVTDAASLKRWTDRFKEERAKAEKRRLDEERERELSEGERYISAEIEKIRAVDPHIRDFADLQRSEKREEMEAMIRRGYDVADAYILAHRESLLNAKVRAAKQEALTSVAGRGHLDRSGGGGALAPEIPAEQMRAFRRMLPKASLAEIQRFYQKDRRDTKRD